jgi:hypothetical protein
MHARATKCSVPAHIKHVTYKPITCGQLHPRVTSIYVISMREVVTAIVQCDAILALLISIHIIRAHLYASTTIERHHRSAE